LNWSVQTQISLPRRESAHVQYKQKQRSGAERNLSLAHIDQGCEDSWCLYDNLIQGKLRKYSGKRNEKTARLPPLLHMNNLNSCEERLLHHLEHLLDSFALLQRHPAPSFSQE
jgi:hypothetical protein